MYDFKEMIEEIINDKTHILMQMENQTKRAIAIVSGLESGPDSEFGSIVSDMVTHYNQYRDFIKNANQQYHLSIQMYLYLAEFCMLSRVCDVVDVGCGWNPLQSFYFSNLGIRYTGVDYPSRNSVLVEMLNTPYNKGIQYISAEYPDVEIEFPKYANRLGHTNRLGIFLYSMNNLVDTRNYQMVDKEKIGSTQLRICHDFDIVAFTVFNGFNEEIFADSPMAKTHRIVYITETFEFDDDGPNTDTRLVFLAKKHPNSSTNWEFSEYPEKEYWTDDAEKFKPVGKLVTIEIKEDKEFEINE